MLQRNDSKFIPVAFASKKLSDPEKRFSTIEELVPLDFVVCSAVCSVSLWQGIYLANGPSTVAVFIEDQVCE